MVLQGNVAESFPVSGFMHLVCRYLVKLHGPGMGQVQPSLKESAENRILLPPSMRPVGLEQTYPSYRQL